MNNNIPIDIAIFSFFLILIPIALISGPAIPDIILSLIAFYFLTKTFSQKLWKYYKNPIVIGSLLFSLYSFIRSLFSEMPTVSLTNEGSAFYFRYIFFSMGVWYLLDKNQKLSKQLMLSSVFCLLVVCFDGLYQYFSGFNILGFPIHGEDRLTGLFGKEPILGRYVAYISIFTFALFYENYKKTKKMMILSVAFLVLSEVIVFLTGERAPFFLISLFSILILIFIPKFRFYRVMGILTSIIIVVGIIELNPTAKKRMVNYTIEQVSQTSFPFLPYSKAHEEHYISALKMFNDFPIFGIGTNLYRFQSQKLIYSSSTYDINSHPHNYYIQTLSELGIIGFLFVFSFFLYLFFIGIKQLIFILSSNKISLIPFQIFLYPMILFVYWWPIIPHMSFYNNWNNVLIMLPLGFFLRNFYGGGNK